MKRLSWFNVTALTLGFAFLYLPMVILVTGGLWAARCFRA